MKKHLIIRKLIIAFLVILMVALLLKRKDMTWRQSLLKTFYPVIMLPGKLFGGSSKGVINKKQMQPTSSFYELQVTLNNGTTLSLETLKGKKLMLVNTASDCGYTGQYAELETLYKLYKDKGLVIIGFPANDFKQQEQRDDAAIAEFCKVNYGVTFLLAKKSSVIKGPEQNPVFQWLSNASLNGWNEQEPTWNFCKYIVNENGVLEAFFPQGISPMDQSLIKYVRP
jgi:glutathione peroxidase